MPANRPMSPGSMHERFIPNQRFVRQSSRRSPSPPDPSRSHSYRKLPPPIPLPLRRQRSISPPPVPSSHLRPPRRHYAPYIPLPPDLLDYVNKASSRPQQRSPPAPIRRSHHHNPPVRHPRSRSPRSPVHRVSSTIEPTIQHEPSRMLIIENLDRNIAEPTLSQIFSDYGFIESGQLRSSVLHIPHLARCRSVEIKKSSSKRPVGVIKFATMAMAFEARDAMNGQPIGESVSKISYGT